MRYNKARIKCLLGLSGGKMARRQNDDLLIEDELAAAFLNDVSEIKNLPIKIVAFDIPEGANYTARLEVLLQSKDYAKETPVDKEHTALITFTTGSSGTPKGADRSHRFLAAQHYALNRHLPYGAEDRDLPVFPIFSLNNLAAGVETVIPAIDVGQPGPNDGKILYAQLKSANVTCTTLSPSLFNGLSAFCLENNLNLNFLKRIVTGGAPISRDDIERMKREAEVNAESDKIERENAEKLNSADSLVFQTEKFVSENADKLSTDDKASLDEKIQNLKTAFTEKRVADLDNLSTELNNVLHPITSKMYESQSQPEQDNTSTSSSNTEDVEYEEVTK
jgi:hypothetical protein